jgi:hypothetical protein
MHEYTAAKTPPSVELSAIIVNWFPSQVTLGALGGANNANCGKAEVAGAEMFVSPVTLFAAAASCAIAAEARTQVASPSATGRIVLLIATIHLTVHL